MKTIAWWVLIALFCAESLLLAQAPQETGVVKGKVVNVRGQPSIFSEVITQLKEGDQVAILEEINVEKPKPEDVAQWYRIQMPANTPVWVHASFVDANSEVTARRLNMRGGPGENYSVLGRLEQGDKVKEIRRKENWIEIEPSEKAYAFIAAELVEKQAGTPAQEVAKTSDAPPAAVETAPPAPAPIESTKPESAVTNQPEIVHLPTPPVAQEAARPPAPAMTSTSLPPVLANPPILEQPAPLVKAPSTPPPPLRKRVVEPLPRRIVTREGVVRGTISIQAPTDFLLESPYNGVAMNYLLPTTTNIVLKNFRGKRVVVSGEEALDARWPNTPVLIVDSLTPAPSKGE